MQIENAADLWVLVHTARTGSLTAAAAVVGVTPAAASATLKRLEARLRSRLFERSTRAMRLTPEGQTLLEYATRAFELLDEGEAQIGERGGAAGTVGTLRLTAPSHLSRALLMPWIDEFLTAHPGVSFVLHVGDRALDVIRDEVDVALRYGELNDSRLVARRLSRGEQIVTAAPSYLARHPAPRRPADLAQHNCLVYGRAGRRYSVWRFARRGAWTQVRVTSNRVVDDASLAHEWAVAGAGILLKTALEQRADLARGALVQLLKGWQTEPYPLHALLPSGRFVPHRVRAFVDFLAEKFAAAGELE